MTKQAKEAEEAEEQQSSPAAGGCVALVLTAVPISITFATSPVAGVLVLWAGGVGTLWWACRRRVSDSSATPPPDPVGPSGDVYADETPVVDRVERGPEGVMCIIHPVRQEVRNTP